MSPTSKSGAPPGALPRTLVDEVLARLRVNRPPAPDLEGLEQLYLAWCNAIPFDNVLKMIHVSEGRAEPLPGSTADDFFRSYLATGAGGTCWAGNNALYQLVTHLGYRAERMAATMLAAPDTPGPNHGSVLVTLPGGRYIIDASVLANRPLAVPAPDQPPSDALPRLQWSRPASGGAPVLFLWWRTLHCPDGFPCRIDHVGLAAQEWDALHQRTAVWSPFNYALSARTNRGPEVLGFGQGQRYGFDAGGAVSAEACGPAGRLRFLIDELGVEPALAARVPPDRDVPPAPPDFHRPTSAWSGRMRP